MRPGIRVEIPGFGPLELTALLADYTGTLASGGPANFSGSLC